MRHLKTQSLSTPVKFFLLLVAILYAIAVVILISSYSSAATVTGAAPSLAISLANDLNTGILAPGEQRWFKLTPGSTSQSSQVEQSLTLFFTPDDGQQIRQVSLQLFAESQLPFFYEGNADKMTNFGAGQLVSRDNNPRSGELFWTGWLFQGQGYYLQLKNDKQIPIDYWLLTKDVISYPLDTGEMVIAESQAPESPSPLVGGQSPQAAIPMQMAQYQGNLAPAQEIWYSFSVADQDGDFFEEMGLTMFATPDTHHQIDRLAFEVFTAAAVTQWSPGVSLPNVGAGSLVQRDNDPLTGARFWTGWVVDSDLYYIRISNSSNDFMDYWLFVGDIYNPALGQVSN